MHSCVEHEKSFIPLRPGHNLITPSYKNLIFICAMRYLHYNFLTYSSLASFYRTSAKSAEPDQTPQNTAPDQALHYLLKEGSIKI